MIHIHRNYETLFVELQLGDSSIGYHRFEISFELLTADTELHSYYYDLRSHGVGGDDMRMSITLITQEKFFNLRSLAARARGRHAGLFENNNLGARGIAEGSVLA